MSSIFSTIGNKRPAPASGELPIDTTSNKIQRLKTPTSSTIGNKRPAPAPASGELPIDTTSNKIQRLATPSYAQEVLENQSLMDRIGAFCCSEEHDFYNLRLTSKKINDIISGKHFSYTIKEGQVKLGSYTITSLLKNNILPSNILSKIDPTYTPLGGPYKNDAWILDLIATQV